MYNGKTVMKSYGSIIVIISSFSLPVLIDKKLGRYIGKKYSPQFLHSALQEGNKWEKK